VSGVGEGLCVVVLVCLVALLVYCLAHFGLGYGWHTDRYAIHDGHDQLFSRVLLGLAIGAWALNGWLEVNAWFDRPLLMTVLLTWVALSMVLFVWLAHRLHWSDLHLVKYVLTPLMVWLAIMTAMGQQFHEGYGWVAWALAWSVNYGLLWLYDNKRFRWISQYHVVSLWLLVWLLMHDSLALVGKWLGSDTMIYQVTIPVVLLLVVGVIYGLRHRLQWPLVKHHSVYFHRAVPVLMGLLWVMVVLINGQDPGELMWLPYLPIFNAIDGVTCLTIGLMAALYRHDPQTWFMASDKLKLSVLALTGFMVLNATMLRCFNFWYGIEYQWTELMGSYLVQTGFSVLWAATAVSVMVLAAKRHWRHLWLLGLGLMIVVVVKLFLVDMSASGTIERIVAFLTVGFLLSVVGYFSPLPPELARKPAVDQTEAAD